MAAFKEEWSPLCTNLVFPIRFEPRQKAVEEINKKFGTNIEVSYYDGLPTTEKELEENINKEENIEENKEVVENVV